MITILFIWLILSILLEHVLALTPATIPNVGKKALYYVLVAPAIGLEMVKGLLGKLPDTWLKVSSWFRM